MVSNPLHSFPFRVGTTLLLLFLFRLIFVFLVPAVSRGQVAGPSTTVLSATVPPTTDLNVNPVWLTLLPFISCRCWVLVIYQLIQSLQMSCSVGSIFNPLLHSKTLKLEIVSNSSNAIHWKWQSHWWTQNYLIPKLMILNGTDSLNLKLKSRL